MYEKLLKDLSRRLAYYQLKENDLDYDLINKNLNRLLLDLEVAPHKRHLSGYVAGMQEIPLSISVDYVVNSSLDDALLKTSDVVLVPLRGFTQDNYRLGRGGGFYDRLLAKPGLVSIGVGSKHGRVLFIPEAHDIPLDYIVTEDGVNKL